MSLFLRLFLAIAPVLAISVLGGIITARNLVPWYQSLQKPAFTPPGWVFGPVWTVLYILLAFAIWRALGIPPNTPGRTVALWLLWAQLALNAAWPWMFFGLQSPLAGLVNIVPQWLLLAATIVALARLDTLAAVSLVPLAIWVGFASILNFSVWKLN